MTLSDADLRAAFAATAPATAALPECDCAGDIIRAAAGDLPAEELPALLAKVRSSPACAALWAAVQQEISGGPEASLAAGAEPTVPEPVPANMPWRWGLMGAVAVAAAVTIAVLSWPGGPTSAPDWRASGDRAVVLDLPDGAMAEGRQLRWQPVGEAYEYSVRLMRPDLTPVEELRVVAPPAEVPESLAGQQLLWQVTAYLPDGTVRRSDTRHVVVP